MKNIISYLTPFLILIAINLFQISSSYFFYLDRPFLFLEYLPVILLSSLKHYGKSFLLLLILLSAELYLYIGRIFNGLNKFTFLELIQSSLDAYGFHAYIVILITAVLLIIIYQIYKKIKISSRSIPLVFLFSFFVIVQNSFSGEKTILNRVMTQSITSALIDRKNRSDSFDAFSDFKLEKNFADSAVKATTPYLESRSKVSLIIIESFANYENELINHSLIDILENNKNINFIKHGMIQESDSTVSAELRELCELKAIGYGITKIPDEFECLPKFFKDKDFYTFSLHGGAAKFYNRYMWYSQTGFEYSYFSDNLKGEECHANWKGYCDYSLMDFYFKNLKNKEHSFGYWLTLNSHYPYSKEDLKNKDEIKCQHLQIKTTSNVCGNYLLVNEFLENLSLKITENSFDLDKSLFIIAGDHQPYFLDKEERKYLHKGMVPYLIFEVKQ